MGKRKTIQDHPELLGTPEVRKLWQTEGLFSDHYLKARLELNDWWPSDTEAQPAFRFCKELYEKRALALRRYDNEMGVRQEFIDKILERLGFAWSDNLRLPETKQDLEPDYILYPDPETKERVLDKTVAERYRAGVGILEAKRFGHPLSQISKHQQRYPHQQIRDYLQESDSIVWGILTNGEVWRLYCRDSKASHYFALNFEAALNSLQDFKVFLALFSSAAFTRDAQGKCRLDQVRESALATQAELEADLRRRIFTVVEILANGFAERPENKITDADLPVLYENCLIFLYRLLFILYAEGRLLLPVEPKSRKYYKQLSLTRLLRPLKSFTEYDSQTQTRFYRDIHALCLLINGTDKKANDEFGVPRYNGGLFDPDRCPLLREWAVADVVLADVLRQLMFTPEKGRQKFVPFESVDFADLSVQQLGSIYEGLLEHHFARQGGRLVLKTDRAERKATGTYYTPDYVVKYIVEQTLTPLLQEIEEREPVKAARAAGKQDNSFADEVLKLNICDPAMGSGHFLVEATTFLGEHIVYHPTTKFQAEFVKGESQEGTEIAYWRRRVVEACIYGVDLNPLAVELAKLSLWLTTISVDQPLNFLDHHLCCGNSLIGARLEELSHVPDKKRKSADSLKLSWKITENLRASLTKAVQTVQSIENAASASVSDVKNKEKLWIESVRPALLPFRTVANLWTASSFGNELRQQDYEALIELLDIHPDKIRPWQSADEFQTIATEAVKKGALKLAGRELDINQLKHLCAFLFRSEQSAAKSRFLHWELEFPEVFFNDDGTARSQPGFDAVIGNPPWGMLQPHNTEEAVLGFLRSCFSCSEFKVDMFQLFLEQSLRLIGMTRHLGMIVPNTLLTNTYCKRIRELFQRQTSIRFLVATAEMIFKDADVHPAIIVAQKTGRNSGHENSVALLVHETSEPFEQMLGRHSHTSVLQEDLAAFDGSTWNVRLDPDFARLVRNLVSRSQRLAELGSVKRGLVSGNRERYFATEKKGPKWYPIATGTDVQRYRIETPLEYVLFQKPGRTAGGCWDERVHLKRGKILLRQVGRWPRAAVDNAPYCITANVFAIILNATKLSPFYLASILNSRLTKVVWQVVLSDFKALFPELKGEWVEQWPIRRIMFTTPGVKRTALLEEAKQLCGRGFVEGSEGGVLAFVNEQLATKPERADVIHDLLAFLAEQMTVLTRIFHSQARKSGRNRRGGPY